MADRTEAPSGSGSALATGSKPSCLIRATASTGILHWPSAMDAAPGMGRRSMPRAQAAKFEELVDEVNLAPNIISAHPLNLPLPDHVPCLIALNGSLRRLEFSEPCLAFTRRLIAW
jgi:hypothetical protein